MCSNHVLRSYRLSIFCGVQVALLCSAFAGGQDANSSQAYLEIETKAVLQQGTVTFERSDADSTLTPFPTDKDGLIGYSTDDAFKLLIDRQSIRFNQFGNYTFTVFAKPRDRNDGLTFYVVARPQGTFGDLEDTVTFHLHYRGKVSSGTIALPLHTVGANDLLETKDSKLPEIIKLSGAVSPSIRLRSALPNFGLQIMQIDVKSDCGNCWQGLAPPSDLQTGSAGRVLSAKGQETEITIAGRPRTWPALRRSLVHFGISDPHDSITLQATYAPVEGGRVRTQDFPIQIRFSPSIWLILLLMGAGTAIGILVRRALGQNDAFEGKKIGIVCATVVVSELILYGSISDTRPLVLFGFNADPTQPLTIFLIALLVSGGPKLTEWISGVAGQLWTLLKGTQVQNSVAGGSAKT